MYYDLRPSENLVKLCQSPYLMTCSDQASLELSNGGTFVSICLLESLFWLKIDAAILKDLTVLNHERAQHHLKSAGQNLAFSGKVQNHPRV